MTKAEPKFHAKGSTVIHRPSGAEAIFKSPAQARRAAREANARDGAESSDRGSDDA